MFYKSGLLIYLTVAVVLGENNLLFVGESMSDPNKLSQTIAYEATSDGNIVASTTCSCLPQPSTDNLTPVSIKYKCDNIQHTEFHVECSDQEQGCLNSHWPSCSLGINNQTEEDILEWSAWSQPEIKMLRRRNSRTGNIQQVEKTAKWKDPEDWVLAVNINPSDGHNFGWGAVQWSGVSAGSLQDAFAKDFLDLTAYRMKANYIAIVRHDETSMNAVKVWKFKESGKSLEQYLKPTVPGRLIATFDGHIQFSHVRDLKVTSRKGNNDPIFGVNGNLAFNWWYSNNGARICLDGGHLSAETIDDDNNHTHGLGNEFGANTKGGKRSTRWWHDVANIQNPCRESACEVQGTDHGTRFKDPGERLGQYAIFVSKNSSVFPAVFN